MKRVLPALFVALLVASAATAQEAPPVERYVGHYRYQGTPQDGHQRVVRAFTPLINRLNPLARALANRRLADSDGVPRNIDVWVRGARVFVRYSGRGDDEEPRTYESRLGRPVEIETSFGTEATLTQLFREGHLEQIFEGPRGRWYNVFTLDETNQQLLLRVVITSERLPRPVELVLPYVRAER